MENENNNAINQAPETKQEEVKVETSTPNPTPSPEPSPTPSDSPQPTNEVNNNNGDKKPKKLNQKQIIRIAILGIIVVIVTLSLVLGLNWNRWFNKQKTNLIFNSKTLTSDTTDIVINDNVNIDIKVNDFYVSYGYTLPTKLESVDIDGVVLKDDQYKYEAGNLKIDAKYVTGKVTVTGEANAVNFESDSWSNIISYASRGLNEVHIRYGRDSLAGLEHSITTSDNATYKVRVIGEGHDRIFDEENNEPTTKAATLTFEFESTIVDTTYNDAPTDYYDSNLQAVCDDIYTKMPSDLQKAIQSVVKYTSSSSSDNAFTTERIFPLSYREIDGYEPIDIEFTREESCYEYYRILDTNELKNSRIKNAPYWLRSPNVATDEACMISSTGEISVSAVDTNLGVAPCFAIGETESFVTDSWENVTKYANFGIDYIKEKYHLDSLIGLEKEIVIKGEPYRVKVIGEKHDNIANSNKVASLTFEFVTPTSPEGVTYVSSTSSCYSDSHLRDYVANDFFTHFPDILKEEIPLVSKRTVTSDGGIEITDEQLFVPSVREMGDDFFGVAEPYSLEEHAYQYYRYGYGDDSSMLNKLRIKTNEPYWLRSYYCYGNSSAHIIDPLGRTYQQSYPRVKVNTALQTEQFRCYPAFSLGYSDPEVNFNTDSWDNVCYHAEFGLEHLKQYYDVTTFIGEEREVTLAYIDEDLPVVVRARVIGENADTTSDGKTTTLTFEFTSAVNAEKVSYCEDDQVPPTWTDSHLRDYCNYTVFNSLPEILRDSIKEVKKKTVQYNGLGKGFSVLETNDKIFALSRNEIYDYSMEEKPRELEEIYLQENPTYDYYVQATDMVRRKSGHYWTRSSDVEQGGYSPYRILAVRSDGGWDQQIKPTEIAGVAPAFAI